MTVIHLLFQPLSQLEALLNETPLPLSLSLLPPPPHALLSFALVYASNVSIAFYV